MTLKLDCVLNISVPQIQTAPYVAPRPTTISNQKNFQSTQKPKTENVWERGTKVAHKVEKKVSKTTQDHHSDTLNVNVLELNEKPKGIVEQKLEMSGLNIKIVKKVNPPLDVEQATQQLKGLLKVTSPAASDHISSQIFSNLDQSEPMLPYSNVSVALSSSNELVQLVGGRKKYKGKK
jgi:hypothetical protein